jgi:hypothetical protein
MPLAVNGGASCPSKQQETCSKNHEYIRAFGLQRQSLSYSIPALAPVLVLLHPITTSRRQLHWVACRNYIVPFVDKTPQILQKLHLIRF